MQQELNSKNGWSEYEKLVLFRLEEHAEQLAGIDAKVSSLQTAVALLKFKVALIGSATGLLASGVVQWMTSWLS